ncbi:MAG TPA: KilA-N domain-containing protein [Azospirillum sp.]
MLSVPIREIPELRFNNRLINREGDFWCLTDMHKAGGRGKHSAPSDWLILPEVTRFVPAVERTYHDSLRAGQNNPEFTGKSGILPAAVRRSRGRNGGTWAHWQVALAYARYLSPEFHMWANEIVRRYLDADPAMVEDMFQRMSVPDQKRTVERLEGIRVHRSFTDALKDHGVVDAGYAKCIEAIQEPILGMPSRVAKIQRGIAPRKSVRDVMSEGELAMTRMAEAATTDRIKVKNAYGNDPCAKESARSARIVKAAYDRIVMGD